MQLAHTRRGGGPLLVVLRQLEREVWSPVLDRLAREREVVAVDLPGFGDSPALPDGTMPTIQALAAAVAGWLPGAGLDRPPVVGNSLGGAVALELARTGAVGGAVALSPIGLWTSLEAAYALGSLRVARQLARALGDRTDLVSGNPVGRTLAFWQLVARPWRVPPPVADAALRSLAHARTFDAAQRAVRPYRLRPFEPAVPVTIAWGARDLLTPPHQARRAARLLPGVRHVALPGCGHSPMGEAPDQVARLIGDATAP
ncbi:alpha/beta fold hydrolase [Thermomonospora cellulosilytica]|uniref:Pimeloyl-ACP methyl ester carboxylesterase n=1 Tax=Thermomonospora cellulosilytica TaxID=1411118 RepID=A0A7W3N0M7_9ACTN|nr:alpha/beta fold hydrolase [Thermomonospora cellulosilytica]MBA9005314.1 pimeloyl-ACP methyl ester carboxylesterase [Thermomonospora cellulosilytica]